MSTLPNVGPGSLKYRDVAPSSVKMVRTSVCGDEIISRVFVHCTLYIKAKLGCSTFITFRRWEGGQMGE